jgi:hypothetical protein
VSGAKRLTPKTADCNEETATKEISDPKPACRAKRLGCGRCAVYTCAQGLSVILHMLEYGGILCVLEGKRDESIELVARCSVTYSGRAGLALPNFRCDSFLVTVHHPKAAAHKKINPRSRHMRQTLVRFDDKSFTHFQ